LIEQAHGGGEGQPPGFAELLELHGEEAGKGEGFRQLELAPVGFKRELVEAGDVLEQAY
jgi:hypothetical protein